MKRKRQMVNPNRRPATEADVRKAKKAAARTTIDAAWAIFFTVLRDKEGLETDRLIHIWDNVNKLSEEISEGYVDVRDLMATLREEAGLTLGEGTKNQN